jgi:hypothetical protein
MTRPQNFDRIARLYRWAEYAALGPFLQRARTHFLPELNDRRNALRNALILGDGDGRFLAALLHQNPNLQATAIDASAQMLTLLTQRCAFATSRLTTHQANLETFTPTTTPDLITTHFVLDCLDQPAVNHLATTLAAHTKPGTLWLLSDFGLPTRPLARTIARAYIRALYLTFRLLTNLQTQHLPDHTTALTRAGFTRIAHHQHLKGLLFTELWQRD